ncbi:hypothetical protein [Mycolicibacterium sphagni]|uniref:hypothetical protein n=1 Tax=Mycolicibacterium sphagni TaxID=1786 RepID=UPI001055E903|nr:hypothetical protein [Mycolicibacterium sphagni]
MPNVVDIRWQVRAIRFNAIPKSATPPFLVIGRVTLSHAVPHTDSAPGGPLYPEFRAAEATINGLYVFKDREHGPAKSQELQSLLSSAYDVPVSIGGTCVHGA